MFDAVDGLKLSRADQEELLDTLNREKAKRFRTAMRDQATAMRARLGVGIDRKAECVPELSIHPHIYHTLGQKFGYGIWKDPEFIKYVNATIECKLRPRVTNPSFRVEMPSRKKFTKNYGTI
jgi:hypothetical protein